MSVKRKICFEDAKRIVVKVGSGVLTEDNGLNLKALRAISRQICQLANRGLEIILVSSGAMASGIKKIGLSKRPDEIPKRQAVAAVGQAGLIMEYEKSFARYNKKVAQILLTSDDLVNRKRYLNARNTLCTLLSWQVIPIINENDTVVVEEIKFGDNDNLSAMITLLMDADILINLTDIDGLYTRDPRKYQDAELIQLVTTITKDIEKYASDIPGALGTGGMLSKIIAAKKVTAAGIPMLIARGEKPDILIKLFAGKEYGTFFIPKKEKLANRKCWIAFTLKPKGTIMIDDGAAAAILKNGKSLLPSGIVRVEGEFSVGAAVEFRRESNDEILGTGLVNYCASDIRKIMGLKSGKIKKYLGHKSYDEVIHRDNLAITCDLNP
jgi:glutamate 5-kinase